MRKCLLLLGLLGLLAVTRAEGNDACQADFDGSGVVDFADFLLFNTLYGQRGGETCAAAVDADSLAVVTALRDSMSALQAALGATRFAVATLQATTTELQTALASETERANENQRLLTASNEAFNSLAQTHCTETEPAAPAPQPEPPVVIETQPEPEPQPTEPCVNFVEPMDIATTAWVEHDFWLPLASFLDHYPESSFYAAINRNGVDAVVAIWRALSTQEEKLSQVKAWFNCE